MSKKEILETIFWQPSPRDLEDSLLGRWMQELGFSDYKSFHQWSVEESQSFWSQWLQKSSIVYEGNFQKVYVPPPSASFYGGQWFPDLRLNFAENLLAHLTPRPLVHWEESGSSWSWTREDLLRAVSLLQEKFVALGIGAGDVVAGILPHRPETTAAMLAATSLGAVWTSCSPDFGVQGIWDRFSQVHPKILLTVGSTTYNGKTFALTEKNREVHERLSSVKECLDLLTFDFRASPRGDLRFTRLPFQHPLYILYSSGTTGAPKCLIHTAGGSLLQHTKELKLHCDLKADERIFYFTTCGWMMWNWVVSSLACGAELHSYEGSPSYPHLDSLWERVGQNRIHVFGTSAKYISSCRIAGAKNLDRKISSHLRLVLSTGSPLLPEDFDYFYTNVSPDHRLQLASISGGTDIVSCFMLGCPVKAVVRGEIQCLGLGMDVRTFNAAGQSVTNEEGELVCARPFPSMPLAFVNDPDFAKYRAAYFEKFPGVWHHGDYISLTDQGGVRILGRSDATLNPGGVRIGTAEIYRQIESIEAVKDSLVVGQSKDGDERVLLFVQLKEGFVLDEALKTQMKTRVRQGASPRHVPAEIFAVTQIPYTLSGKKVELAVKNILAGREVKNVEALANPESLEEYRQLKSAL